MDKYIKLDQKILNWDWYKDINTFKLFLHLLLKANCEDVKIQGIEVPCGSFISTYQTLAAETGLTIQNVRTAINHLKSTGEINVNPHSTFSIFTIKKYGDYQVLNVATNGQLTINQYANKNHTVQLEERKINTKITYEQKIKMFDTFWSTYPRKKSKALAEQAYMELILSGKASEEQIVDAAKNYAESCKILETSDNFINMPHNWLNKSVWIDYLEENYKKPKILCTKQKVRGTGFSNFEQRDYDFDKLEIQLLEASMRKEN